MLPLLTFALLLAGQNQAHAGHTLKTANYTVTITPLCGEYEVGCDKVQYRSVSKSGKSLTLMGTQLMALCADGKTPCHSIGYRFQNHGVTYTVFENGELNVTQGKKTLVDENGKWADE